jgi:ribosomal protein L11 methyltransferase
MGDKPAHWLEVSLLVDGELAEAIADTLGRFVSNGVVIESGITYNDLDEGQPSGPVRIYGYLPVDGELEANQRKLEEALWHLGQIQPLPPLQFKTIVDEDWMVAWKQHYHPIPLGKRLLILPAWYENQDAARVAVRIDPSMAFGTGTHPTTQLCLELLEDYLEPGQAVIDVGCGSGILSIAALKLGASRALAVDIDRQAIRSTIENATTNEVLDRLESGSGSAGDIAAGKFSYHQAPLVLANILAPVIIQLFTDHLADLILPGGILILSGILDRQVAEVLQATAENGLELVEQRQTADWVAPGVRRPVVKAPAS